MSKHWKRFAAVVVSLTMAFQFCVNDFYAYAETGTSQTDSVEETNTGQPQTPAEPTESAEPAPEAETDTTDPAQTPAEDMASGQESQDSDPAQGQTPVNEEEQPQEQEEAASTLKLEFKDEAGTTLKTVDPIALTGKTVGQPISLTEVGVDTNIEGYTLVDIKDKNDSTKDYNANSVEFTLTKNITELQLVYRANPKEPETAPTENNTNTTEDSQQGEAEEDSEADEEESDKKTPTIRAMLLANPDQQVTVTVTYGDTTETRSINVGSIETNAPVIDGYVFNNAKVGNTIVDTIAYDETTNSYYVTTSDNQLTGIKIDDTTRIVLNYKQYVETFDITYEVYVDNQKIPNNNEALEIVGASQAEDGDDLEFSFSLKKGYIFDHVQAGDKKVNGNDGIYTIEDISQDTTVSIYLEKIKSYSFDFVESSNTTIIYNGHTYYSNSDGTVSMGTYSAGSQTLTFTVKGRGDQNTMDGGALNKLVLIIDGVQYSVNTPADPESEGSFTTNLSNGYTVTLKHAGMESIYDRGKGSKGSAPVYQVTIQANSEEGLHGDIQISTNYKTSKSSEVWVKQADGVEDNNVYVKQNYNEGKTLNPNKFEFLTRTTNRETNVYFNVAPGYSTDVDDITITVEYDGEAQSYTAQRLNNQSYDYYFTIPEDSTNRWPWESGEDFQPKDIRIYISVKALEKAYVAEYNYGNGESATTIGSYKDGDNFLVSDNKENYPTRDGYVFVGWKLGDTVYKPDSLFSINSQTEDLAKQDPSTGNYVFEFEAVWENAETADKALYTINVFFENSNGYSNSPDVTLTEYGPNGETAFLVQSEIDEVLSQQEGLPENWQKDYELDNDKNGSYSVEITSDGSSVLNIYYRLQRYTITTNATNGTITPRTDVRKGSTFTVSYSANEGYILSSIRVDGQEQYDPNDPNNLIINQYQFTDVNGDHTIEVTYERNTESFSVQGFNVPYDGNAYSVTTEGTILSDEKWQYSTDDGKTWLDGQPDNTEFVNVSESPGTMLVRVVKENVPEPENVVWYASVDAKISKRSLTLTSADLEKEYDGDPLVNGETPLAVETGWADGEGATYTFTGSQTLVGHSANAFTINWNEGTDENNYNLTKTEGQLTVSNREAKYEVTVVANSGSKTYDGEELAVSGFQNEGENGIPVVASNGKTYYVTGLTSEATGTDVADSVTSIPVNGTAVVKDAEGNVVTDDFNVKVTNGSLTISKANLTLTSADLEKEYDGDPLVNGETPLAVETGWADGEGATYTFTGSQTLVGHSANAFTINWNEGTDENNYNLTKTEGQLTVSNREAKYEVTVVANSGSKTYDGEELAVSGFQNEGENGIPVVASNGKTYYVTGLTSEATGTDVADSVTSIPVNGTAVVKDAEGNVVTDQFSVNTQNGTLTIGKREVTITVADASKVYGTSDPTFATPTVEGLVDDKDLGTVSVVRTNTDEDVGVYEEVLSAEYTSNNNYDVTIVPGNFTITQQSIDPGEDPDNPDPSYKDVTVNSPSNVTYDGTAHQWKPTVTSGDTTLTEGTDYTVSYSTTDFTNVTGTITVTITGTGNYAGTVTRTYQINPRAITLTSSGGTKTYDGTVLTNGTVTITAGSLANPSDLTYRATGTQTEVGSSLNTIEVNYASDQMRANYSVTLQTGTLTVNAAPVTPVTPTPTPGGGDEGTGTDTTPTAGGPVAVADDDADAEEEPEEEEVEDEETPLSDGEEEVDDGKTPLAKIDVWALINLIAAIITVLLGLILLLSKRHKNDEEEDEEERQARIERGEEKEQEQKRGWICKVLGVLVAIGSVVLFILTEDMSLPMVLIDEWTIWMVIIAVVELVLLLVGRHWKDVDDDEEEQAQA